MKIKDNKGFSLIEIIVVIGISSIVLTLGFGLIINSTRFYTRENSKVDIQTENQMIVSNLNEAFMEATSLKIEESTDYILIDLGEYQYANADGTETYTSKGKSYCRRLYYNMNKNYLGLIADSRFLASTVADLNTYLSAAEDNADREELDGYMLTNKITDFSIEISSDCTHTSSGVVFYSNPITLVVRYNLEGYNVEDDLAITINLRNYLDEIIINGNSYKVVDKYLETN